MLKYKRTELTNIIIVIKILLMLISSNIAAGIHLPIIFNSFTSPLSTALVKGVYIALRDKGPASNFHPIFIDLAKEDLDAVSKSIATNKTLVLISLLNNNEKLIKKYEESPGAGPLKLFTLRKNLELKSSQLVSVWSLEMSERARIVALLHRISKVGTKNIRPVLESKAQNELLNKYKEIAMEFFPELKILFPIYLRELKHKHLKNETTPVLLLAPYFIRSPGVEHTYKVFSHELLSEDGTFGFYTVQYDGAISSDPVEKKRLLKEFNKFIGPTPQILSVMLAYDSALVALSVLESHKNPSDVSIRGLSGTISFNNDGTRTEGSYIGISTLPGNHNSFKANFLQPSNWTLEDSIQLTEAESGRIVIGNYKVATSSVLSRSEIFEIGKKVVLESNCTAVTLLVSAHDPFNQIDYKYKFHKNSLPEALIIPNENAYGLTFFCHRGGSLTTSLQIACFPSQTSQDVMPVQCYRSNRRRDRERRSFYNYSSYDNMKLVNKKGHNSDSRVDSGQKYYYPSYPITSRDGYNAGYSSTPSTLTSRLDVPINEDPSTPAPTPGQPKLPELRQILKAAKPFVGSCVGSTTGCAICVLVLGRLPLGVVPAACTGPCFVGTFGTCGSLLGRVFSETTVICTELFRQGLIDMTTFIADANFGSKMRRESPSTLLGYQVLATPLVSKMRESEAVTKLVAFFAVPWSEYMKYLMGYSSEYTIFGYLVHTIGSIICTLVGLIITNQSREKIESIGYSLGFILILTWILLSKYLKNK